MNYLARHLTNAHGLTNRVDALNAASKYRQLEEDVPLSERDAYRDHVVQVAESQAERKKELIIEREKQQQSPEKRQPRTPERAESSTKRRRVDDTAEHGKANADVVEYLKVKVPQIRKYAVQARRFADCAEEFAGICDEVAGIIARSST